MRIALIPWSRLGRKRTDAGPDWPGQGSVHIHHLGTAGPPPVGRSAARRRDQVRALLGAYLGCRASEVPLVRGPFGKPGLSGAGAALRFSVSHSGALTVVALTQHGEIGLDLERLGERHGERRGVSPSVLAARIATEAEASALARLSHDEAGRALTTLWTRKEAVLKALGLGLHLDPRLLEIGFEPLPRAFVACGPGGPVPLVLADVPLGLPWACSVAVGRGGERGGERMGGDPSPAILLMNPPPPFSDG